MSRQDLSSHRSVDVRADLESQADPARLHDPRRLGARLVVGGLPESLLLREVDLPVAGDQLAAVVEEETGIVPPARVRITDDGATEERNPRLPGREGLTRPTGPLRILGVVVGNDLPDRTPRVQG